MGKYLDQDGNEVEAFSQEEVDERLEETKQELELGMEELKSDIETKKEEIDKLNEDLKNVGNKDYNFKSLRESKEKLEKEKVELESKLKGVGSEIDKKFGEFEQKLGQKDIDAELRKGCKGDEEKFKVAKFHFNTFKTIDEKDPEKRTKALETYIANAVKLAGVDRGGSALDRVGGAGAGFVGRPKDGGMQTKEVSADAKEMGKEKCGLTDDDFKNAEKYESK